MRRSRRRSGERDGKLKGISQPWGHNPTLACGEEKDLPEATKKKRKRTGVWGGREKKGSPPLGEGLQDIIFLKKGEYFQEKRGIGSKTKGGERGGTSFSTHRKKGTFKLYAPGGKKKKMPNTEKGEEKLKKDRKRGGHVIGIALSKRKKKAALFGQRKLIKKPAHDVSKTTKNRRKKGLL